MKSRFLVNALASLRSGMRFSMRTLLAIMLVAAIFFAWFGWRLRKSQRQAHALAVLEQFGAIYSYDFQGPIVRSTTRPSFGKLIVAPGQSAYPRRLRKLLGVDFLHNVTRVHLETSFRLSTEEIDRLWKALGDLPDLIYLEASGPVTRPGAIQQLGNCPRLKRLALRWANISDGDLAILERMPRLEELNLNETAVTDAAMAHVARSHNLGALELHHTKITDDGLAAISRLSRLRRLRLSGTMIGDTGIRQLRGLSHLNDLDLVHTRVTDVGLHDVADLSSLDRLDLSMTAVTEQGLAHLQRLPHLRCLKLETMTAMPDILAAIPKLPALEELHGPLLRGDLARIAECPKLRVLHSGFAAADLRGQGLKLPPTLEEISGLALNDDTIDVLAGLENLKVVHADNGYMYDPDKVAEFQRLRARLHAARPTVSIR